LPIIELVTIHGQFIDTRGFNIPGCEDPDDNKFIECAVAGNCKIIISGDKHLSKLAVYHGITILAPGNFVEKYL
jgi:predicted nucleic acid-binding protein